MKTFYQLVVESQIAYSEKYGRYLLGVSALNQAISKTKDVSNLFNAINKQIEYWYDFHSTGDTATNAKKVRQSWIHLPEILGNFQKTLTTATQTAIKRWVRTVDTMIGAGGFQKLYPKYASNVESNKNYPISAHDAADSQHTLDSLVVELKKHFGDDGGGNIAGTLDYMSPEMASKGINIKKELNFTNNINHLIMMLSFSNEEDLTAMQKHLTELLGVLDQGVYYFIGIYDKSGFRKYKSYDWGDVAQASPNDFNVARNYDDVAPTFVTGRRD